MFCSVLFPFPIILRVRSSIEILTNVTELPNSSLVARDNLRSTGISDGTTSQTCRVPPCSMYVNAAMAVIPIAQIYIDQ